jgi:RNA polymerase sigma-70 factor (ECF subfamily)
MSAATLFDVAGTGRAIAAPIATPTDEAALLIALRRGDAAAFEVMVRQCGGRMLATARRMLGDESDAADAVQEAFLAAFKSIDRFEGGSLLSTWLHRITVNAALMKLRTRRRRDERSIEDMLPSFFDDGHRGNVRPGWQPPADELAERSETRAMVRRLIAELPEDHRNVLLLRDIEELSTEDAATVLGIKPGAVKTRLHRARMALRELIEQELEKANQPSRPSDD